MRNIIALKSMKLATTTKRNQWGVEEERSWRRISASEASKI